VKSQLGQFLADAEKFIRSHGSIIGRAPLQAYASALVFTPTASEVRAAQWKHRLPLIKTLIGVQPHWDANRQTLEGHSAEVWSLAFSPDNKMLASASWDKTIMLWEVSTGSHKRTLEGHTGEIYSVTFSPDGKILASSSKDKTVRLWDMPTGSHKRTLEGHSGWVGSVAFSPAGKMLVSCSYDGTIRLWDIDLGICRQIIEEHSSSVRSVTFSPDGKILASASKYEPVHLWDMAHGKHQQTLEMHGGQALFVAFSPDGSILAAPLNNRTIQLWDTGSWNLRQTIRVDTFRIDFLAFSPDGKILAFESKNGILFWDIATGSTCGTLAGPSHTTNPIAFSPDGMILASKLDDSRIRLWDVDFRIRQRAIEERNDWNHHRFRSTVFSPDGETLVFAQSNDLQVWDTATWSCQQTISSVLPGLGPTMVFSPDGKVLAVESYHNACIQLWDTTTWACRLTKTGARPLSSNESIIVFSPDSKTLVTASQEGTVQLWLWDAATGSTLWKLEGDEEVESVAFAPDGKTLATASDIGIEIWDTATRSHRRTLSCIGKVHLHLAFSPDGKMLALASDSGNELHVWNATTWTYLWRVVGVEQCYIFSFDFSSNGAHLLLNYQPFRLPSAPISDHSSATYLYFDKEWICLNGKKILWLPVDCRPYWEPTLSVHDKITWMTPAGRLYILQVEAVDVEEML
jgi:WD40 repeat protein